MKNSSPPPPENSDATDPAPDRDDNRASDAESMTPSRWLRAIAWRKRTLAHEYYRGLDATAREGVSDEDYAITMATLEAMARNLGWDESQGMPGRGPEGWRGHGPEGWRGRGPGGWRGRGWRGHGPHGGFARGFGRRFARDFGDGHSRRHDHCHENREGRENVEP